MIETPRATTHKDKKVFWNNIPFVKLSEDSENYKLTFMWRYKASLKEEIILYEKNRTPRVTQFLESKGLLPLTDSLFVNTSRIIMIQELEKITGKIDYIKLRVIFEEGIELPVRARLQYWDWWKSNRI